MPKKRYFNALTFISRIITKPFSVCIYNGIIVSFKMRGELS